MAKALVIVESPAKAKTINKYLGKDVKVIASMGHVRDLPKSKLGVDVDANFLPDYVVLPDRAKVIKELKEQSKIAEHVYIATDPDREGEAKRQSRSATEPSKCVRASLAGQEEWRTTAIMPQRLNRHSGGRLTDPLQFR